jgi:hypothetical protein
VSANRSLHVDELSIGMERRSLISGASHRHHLAGMPGADKSGVIRQSAEQSTWKDNMMSSLTTTTVRLEAGISMDLPMLLKRTAETQGRTP